MSFGNDGKGKVTRPQYWIAMLINIVLCAFLLIGGIFAVLDGSFFLGLMMILAIVPVGIYFRVIMMRRCRDIGWPPALPWIMFGAGIVGSWINLGSLASGGSGAIAGLSILITLADLVVMIVIGCIDSRQSFDYQEVFADGPAMGQRPQPMAQAESAAPSPRLQRDVASLGMDNPEDESARWDAAINRALAKKEVAAQPAAAAPNGAMMARPQAGGFGRKGL